MRRRKRIYLTAAVLALACALYIGNRPRTAKAEFPAAGWIAEQEKRDVNAVEDELDARDQAEKEAARKEEAEEAAKDKGSLKERFAQAVLVGDSVAEGFIDYEILDPTSIVAQKGLRADSAGADIEKALALSPAALFLSIGLNDLEYCQGDSGRFVREYEKRLQEIRDKAPDLPVYVNAIMPILPAAMEKKPVLGHVDEFNQALKELCEKWEIPFLDNGDLLEGHEDWYQKDSIHLKSTPYPLWLERMEEAAGL